MNNYINNELHKIGRLLDANIFPVVRNGGFVMPSGSATLPPSMGKENHHEQQRQSRPKTRTWEWPSRWEGTTGRCGSTSSASSVIRPDLKSAYEEQLKHVTEAYPGTRVWVQKEGLWLLSESSLLSDCNTRAQFLICVPFDNAHSVRAWGFWTTPSIYLSWIGPRHTNFPDGSICAFEPKDETWKNGDPLVELIDIYTLWAVKQLYLKTFRRWPGFQAAHHPYERLLELREDEYCGCDNSNKLYGECCRDMDMKRNKVADAVNFNLTTGGIRTPPESVISAMRGQKEPPSVAEILPLQTN